MGGADGGGGDGGVGGDVGGDGGVGGDVGGDGGVNMQMHWLYQEHGPVLPPPQTWSLPGGLSGLEYKKQPGGLNELLYSRSPLWSSAVLSDRSSAVAAASHSLVVEMRTPPQEPLSIM